MHARLARQEPRKRQTARQSEETLPTCTKLDATLGTNSNVECYREVLVAADVDDQGVRAGNLDHVLIEAPDSAKAE